MMRKKTVIFIILFVLHISISWNAYADIIPDERAALTDFYNSTDGANWIRQWDTDSSVKVCGNWEGVTCDGNEEHVIGLVLEYNNLKGSIPDTIEKLTDLMGLHLRNNNLEGSVPSGLYNLRNLQVLDLQANNLTGNISDQLNNMTSLIEISLPNNDLTGNIPLSDKLTQLELLDLSNNEFTGTIPGELGNLRSLTDIRLYNNRLEGAIPPELSNLNSLKILYLEGNNLTGSIPNELGELGSLEELSLARNRLTGNIPPELGNLSELQALELATNQLTGNIPPEFGKLTKLTKLTIADNALTGEIPSELMQLENLQDGGNTFEGNALHTSDPDLLVFLGKKQENSDWESTQTLAPAKLEASSVTDNTITLTWPHTNYGGGYLIFYKTGSEEFDPIIIDDIKVIIAQVKDLQPSTEYVFKMQTVTQRSQEGSEVTVFSDFTDEISVTTIDDEGDTAKPFNTGIIINNGDESTVSNDVTLSINADDNVGVTGYSVSEDSSLPGEYLEITPATLQFAGEIPFTLSSGYGEKTVYVCFKDSAGNVSEPVLDTIELKEYADFEINITSVTQRTEGDNLYLDVEFTGTAPEEIEVEWYPGGEENYCGYAGEDYVFSPLVFVEDPSPMTFSPAVTTFKVTIDATSWAKPGNYVIRLKLKDNVGEPEGNHSNIAESDFFTIEETGVNNKPETPTIVSPVNDEVFMSGEAVTLQAGSFSDPDSDEHYSSYWYIKKDDGDIVFDGEITKDEPYDLTTYLLDELYPGRYIWKVRYGDSKIFSEWSDESSFLVKANTPPDKPEAQSPSNDERIEPGNPVTLQASTFSDPDGDEHYSTHWYVTKEDGDLVLNLEITKDETDDLTKYTLSDLSPGYRYIWKVNYGDSKIPSEWSDESSFIVKTETSPDTPTVISPLNEEIIPGKTVNLTVSSFSDPDGDAHNATYWRIERADGERYDEYKNKQAYLEIPNETIPDGFLADGLKYHWSAIYEDSQTQRSISSEKSAFKVGESVDSDPRISIKDWKDDTDFRMISFVHWPDNPGSAEVFKDVNSENYHRDFRMGAYNPQIKNYDEFGSGLKVEPGKAMWFIARDKYDISIKGVPVSTEHDIEVELVYIDNEGGDWNMIGCPNNLSYKWDDVKVLLYSDDKSEILKESQVVNIDDSDNLIDKKIWRWRDGKYAYYSPGDANSEGDSSLKPNEGYWVKAKQKNVFLKFPHEKGTEPSNQENGKQPVSRTSKLRRTITDSIDKPPSPIGSFSDSSKVEDSSGCFISNAASRSGTEVYSVGAGGIVLIFLGLCAILGFKSPGRDDRE